MTHKTNYIIKRTLAYLIDVTIIYLLLMLCLQLLILAPVRHYFGITEDWFKIGWNVQIYVWLTISLPTWIYFIYAETSKYKATIGKKLMSLEVLDRTSSLQISVVSGFKRTALKLLPWELIHIGLNLPEPIWFKDNVEFPIVTLFGILLFIGYFLYMIINVKLQTPYDKLLGTSVVKTVKKKDLSN